MSVKSFTLLDADGYPAGETSRGRAETLSNVPVTLTSCTAANPIVIATGAAHGFQVGDYVKIVSSTIALLDGVYKVTATADTTHFTVTFDNSAGSTTITGKAVSMMALSTASAIAAGASTQDKATVVKTFKQLGNWDALCFELIISANATATLTFDWVIQRPVDPDLTRWDDYFYIAQPNNTAIDNVIIFPTPEVISGANQTVANWAYKDTSTSANGAAVTPGLTNGDARPLLWGNALRLVGVPRAANMASATTVQVLLAGIARS